MAKTTKVGKGKSATRKGTLELSDRDVAILELLQMPTTSSTEVIVFECFAAAAKSRRKGTEWLAFRRPNAPYLPRSELIGLSASVPSSVTDAIQSAIEADGTAVERKVGRAFQYHMEPLARLSDDGLELLTPAFLDHSPGYIATRGKTKAVPRGFVLAAARTAAPPLKARASKNDSGSSTRTPDRNYIVSSILGEHPKPATHGQLKTGH